MGAIRLLRLHVPLSHKLEWILSDAHRHILHYLSAFRQALSHLEVSLARGSLASVSHN